MLGLHEKWRSTFMEHWPDEVIALGLPMEQIMLSEQDRLAMGARTAAFREIFEIDEIPPFTDGLYAGIDEKIGSFPQVDTPVSVAAALRSQDSFRSRQCSTAESSRRIYCKRIRG